MRVRRMDVVAQLEAMYGLPARDVIIGAIEREGDIKRAAERLGVKYQTLYYVMGRLGIEMKHTPIVA